MLRKANVAIALSLTFHALPQQAFAQTTSLPNAAESSPAANPSILSDVTVSATRTVRRVDDVPSSVSVITDTKIQKEGARNLKEAFRNELDVTVPVGPTRFGVGGASTGRGGQEGVNIRGLGGNQVLMLVDGIRIPNGFTFGPFSTGRGDFLDIDGLKSVEILRGPASTQYGSDGLAGAVIFKTLDPSDVLTRGQSVGGFARVGYTSIDKAGSGALAVAGKNEKWQAMVLGSYRQGHETGNKAIINDKSAERTTPNPVDYSNRYLLSKAILTVDAAQQLGLTIESQRRSQQTNVFSARAAAPQLPRSITGLTTQDTIERDRLALEHRYNDLNAAWIQSAETRLYWQDAKVNQYATEKRKRAPERIRENTFRTQVVGLATQFQTNLTGWVNQRLSYGVDLSQAQISALRDGTSPPYGSKFPSRPFPDTTYTLGGAFFQSEIELGVVSVIPGLRFDRYAINPSAKDYENMSRSKLSGQAVTPRIGAVWRLASGFSPYAQLARGFRAPTPDQVNNGFANLASGYTSIGNSELKPEYADSFEIGFRGRSHGLRYSLAGFENRYQNFISQEVIGGGGRPTNPTIYQYVNLANAKIQGVVAQIELKVGQRWTIQTGAAYIKGDSQINGVSTPINSVQPVKAMLGLQYDAGEWGGQATVLYSAAKDPRRIAPGRRSQFATPDYTVFDLGMYWKPSPNLTFNANVNNVLDTKYWRWSDVSGLTENSRIADAYTAAGRTIQVSMRYDF
ncbi:MAG: TonB-dependent receptor [Alcaligenaceae bacterium]|nr:MAG: TonB-dependent receptor [Alcaligenaceae bacterium]